MSYLGTQRYSSSNLLRVWTCSIWVSHTKPNHPKENFYFLHIPCGPSLWTYSSTTQDDKWNPKIRPTSVLPNIQYETGLYIHKMLPHKTCTLLNGIMIGWNKTICYCIYPFHLKTVSKILTPLKTFVSNHAVSWMYFSTNDEKQVCAVSCFISVNQLPIKFW